MPTTARQVLAAGLLLLATACGGGSERAPSEPAQSTPLPSATPFTGKPTPISQYVIRRFKVAGGPDYLAAAAGALWVKTDLGWLLRVDPAANKIAARIPIRPTSIKEDICQGLGADDEAIWACVPEVGVARVDPRTNKIAATVKADKLGVQGEIPVAFGHAWVLTGDGSTLAGIADDEVARTISLGLRCTQLAASKTAIWAACPSDGVAVRVDPVAGKVTARVGGLADARRIATGDDVWVGFSGGVARIDAATARVTAVADAEGFDAGIAVAPDAVWVRAQGDFLRQVRPSDGEVLADITAPEQSGGSVIVAFGSVWASAFDDDVLYRLSIPKATG